MFIVVTRNQRWYNVRSENEREKRQTGSDSRETGVRNNALDPAVGIRGRCQRVPHSIEVQAHLNTWSCTSWLLKIHQIRGGAEDISFIGK